MSDIYETLDQATAALASTAERAAILIRTESARAKEEAGRTRGEIDDIRKEIRAAKAEFEVVRNAISREDGEKDRVRRSAGWAWSAVAVMAACVTVAVGWTSMQLTHGRDITSDMSVEVSELRQTVTEREAEVASLREQLQQSRISETRAMVTMQILSLDRQLASAAEVELPEAADGAAPAPEVQVIQPAVEPAPAAAAPATMIEEKAVAGEVGGDAVVTNQ